jgi:hypothetical protein
MNPNDLNVILQQQQQMIMTLSETLTGLREQMTNQANENSQNLASLRSMIESTRETPPAKENRQIVQDDASDVIVTGKMFKHPSTLPPTFRADFVGMKPQEVQANIREFLFKGEELAGQFGYRADGERKRFDKHPTYVHFVSRGLTGNALKRWMDLDKEHRDGMSWKDFCEWIQGTFGAAVSKTKLMEEFTKLRQGSSVAAYCQDFNNIVASMTAAGLGSHPVKMLCTRFIAGLKPDMRMAHELYLFEDDLPMLQRRAIEIDEIKWGNRMKTPKEGHVEGKPFQKSHQYTPTSGPTPMELDHMEGRFTKLSDAEKAAYREKGWCTFCRAKDHTIVACRHPNKRPLPRKINNIGENSQTTKAQQDYHDADAKNGEMDA